MPFGELAFCVLDVETTGLSPVDDRVVELAVVRIDCFGRVDRELHTLVDPECHVTGTFIHGVTDSDVAGAPRFAEIASEVAELLDEALLVAHNAAFDEGFLRAKIERCGIYVEPVPNVCTMRMRRQVDLPGPSAHRLAWACWQEGIPIESAHAAICDSRATGALLSRYLSYAMECGYGCLGDLQAHGVAADSWHAEMPHVAVPFGGEPVQVLERAGISVTPASLHRHSSAPEHALRAYEVSLAAAAEDFEIDDDEVADLHELVGELGLTSDQVRALHVGHVQQLLDDRLSDGLLSWAEQHEVRAFARLLGVPGPTVDDLLERADAVAAVEGKPAPKETAGSGLSVCFTGEFVAIPLTREEVSELAWESGMEVAPRVTKNLDLLVCRDPQAGTGKLSKAIDYGTVVIDQHIFLALAGVEPAPEGVVSSVLGQLAERRAAAASAADRQREDAAARARARARERRASPKAHQVLWCSVRGHEWSRPAQRGRPPRVCPNHPDAAPGAQG